MLSRWSEASRVFPSAKTNSVFILLVRITFSRAEASPWASLAAIPSACGCRGGSRCWRATGKQCRLSPLPIRVGAMARGGVHFSIGLLLSNAADTAIRLQFRASRSLSAGGKLIELHWRAKSSRLPRFGWGKKESICYRGFQNFCRRRFSRIKEESNRCRTRRRNRSISFKISFASFFRFQFTASFAWSEDFREIRESKNNLSRSKVDSDR